MSTHYKTADEIVAAFGLTSRKSLYYFVRVYGLPCVRFSKKTVRFDEEQVKRWLESNGQGLPAGPRPV